MFRKLLHIFVSIKHHKLWEKGKTTKSTELNENASDVCWWAWMLVFSSACVCVNLCIWTGSQCEINLNRNHNCHSIHCILLLLLLYSYVMCCVWMNCHDSLLDFADAAQWSSLKRTIKTTVLSFTILRDIFSIFHLSFSFRQVPLCLYFHHSSLEIFLSFFFILKSLRVCSTLLSARMIKDTSSHSQLFSILCVLCTRLHWFKALTHTCSITLPPPKLT